MKPWQHLVWIAALAVTVWAIHDLMVRTVECEKSGGVLVRASLGGFECVEARP